MIRRPGSGNEEVQLCLYTLAMASPSFVIQLSGRRTPDLLGRKGATAQGQGPHHRRFRLLDGGGMGKGRHLSTLKRQRQDGARKGRLERTIPIQILPDPGRPGGRQAR